jgi:hypothetical protein
MNASRVPKNPEVHSALTRRGVIGRRQLDVKLRKRPRPGPAGGSPAALADFSLALALPSSTIGT